MNKMAEESDNSDSWGSMLINACLEKSYQIFGTNGHKDSKESKAVKDASTNLDRVSKMNSVSARKAKQIVKVEHKIVSDLSTRRHDILPLAKHDSWMKERIQNGPRIVIQAKRPKRTSKVTLAPVKSSESLPAQVGNEMSSDQVPAQKKGKIFNSVYRHH